MADYFFKGPTRRPGQTPVKSSTFASIAALFSALRGHGFTVKQYSESIALLVYANYGCNSVFRISLAGHQENAGRISILPKPSQLLVQSSTMSQSSMTHSNPYVQGGWNPENSWPNDGSFDPSSPHSSSWAPAQTAFGVLPLGPTPGVLPPGLLGRHLTFRFMSQGNQTNMAFVGPNYRACYRIRTDSTHSYVSVPQGTLARISWIGAEPVMERGGRAIRASEFLRESLDAQGRRIKYMRVNGGDFAWTYDKKAFYIHPANDLSKTIGTVYNAHGVELRILPDGLTTELLNCIVLAIVMMQGKVFVGIQ